MMDRKESIQSSLDGLMRMGTIVDYQIHSNMSGLRWVLYGLPFYGTGRSYTTSEVEAFIDGAKAVLTVNV